MKKIIIFLMFLIPSAVFSNWSSPVVVDTTEDLRSLGYDSVNKIVRDGSGQLFVTYRKHYNDGNGNVYQNFVSYSVNNGTSWNILGDDLGTGPLQVVGRSAGNEGYHQRVGSLAFDKQGNIHFIWYGKDKDNTGNNERQIKYSHFANNDWSDWKNIAPIDGYVTGEYWQEHPNICAGYLGLYAVWEGRDADNSSNAQIKFVKSLDGGNTWSSYHRITGIGADNFTNEALKDRGQSRPFILSVFSPTLNTDILYVFWYGGNTGTLQQIKVSYSSDGGDHWSGYYNIGQQDSGLNAYVQKSFDVAMDLAGNIYVVWSGQDSGSSSHYRLKYSKGSDGNTNGFIEKNEWTKWTNFVSPNVLEQDHPSLGIDIQTNLHLVYQDADKFGNDIVNVTSSKIYYIMMKKNGVWTNKTQISGSKNINIFPYLRWQNNFATGGSLDVIWEEGNNNNDSSFDIVYSQNTSYTLYKGDGASISFPIYKTADDLGIEEGKETAYPNPVDFEAGESVKFVVAFQKGTPAKKTLYVFDLFGNLVYKDILEKQYVLERPFDWDGTKMDGNRVTKGIYFYRIIMEYATGRKEKTKTYKFLVR